MGTLETRTLRVLSGDVEGDPPPDSDTGRIVYAFRRWRGEPKPAIWDEAKHGPWAYADAEEIEDDGEPFEEKFPRLLAELEEQFKEGEKLTATVRKNLEGLAHGG